MRRVHMMIKYKCHTCGKEEYFYCERGVEERSNYLLLQNERTGIGKTSPISIECTCGGLMVDTGIHEYELFQYQVCSVDGMNILINEIGSPVGVPIRNHKNSLF